MAEEKLTPQEEEIIEKYRKDSFGFRVITTAINAVIGLCIGYHYGKSEKAVASIGTSSTNIVQVVYANNSTNSFYLYNGTYLPREKIEIEIRKDKERKLETSLREELSKVTGK